MDRFLEARFKFESNQWMLQLAPEGMPERAWRPWAAPKEPARLFRTIVSPQHDADLLRFAWRLRVRPESFDTDPGALPADICWALMQHHDGWHVLHRGWSLAQMTDLHADEPWPTDGSVTVLGSECLADDLRRRGTAHVTGLAGWPKELPRASVLVVADDVRADTAAEIQALARKARCPLVVWCGARTPPLASDLVEIVPTSQRAQATEPVDQWLARLVERLHGGDAPERALARTASLGPMRDLNARWLRGALRAWKCELSSGGGAGSPIRNWELKIDRTAQQQRRDELVGILMSPEVKRRVQVLVLSGPEGSGLDYFRRRRLRLQDDVATRTPPMRWEVAWSVPASDTLDAVCQRDGAEDDRSLAFKLIERARGDVLLTHWDHPVATTLSAGALTRVTVDELHAYLRSLKKFAEHLDGQSVRVLVTAYVVTDAPDTLDALEDEGDARCNVTALPSLDVKIPRGELKDYLKDHELARDPAHLDEVLKQIVNLSYEELVEWLAKQFPGRLRKA